MPGGKIQLFTHINLLYLATRISDVDFDVICTTNLHHLQGDNLAITFSSISKLK